MVPRLNEAGKRDRQGRWNRRLFTLWPSCAASRSMRQIVVTEDGARHKQVGQKAVGGFGAAK